MLRKLMKYEVKATGRTLLPLYGALLVFSVINKIFIGSNFHTAEFDFLGGIPAMLSAFAYGCTMAAVFIVTFFIVIQRFYKNLLGDQGYLMNTLPVSPWKNIINKLLIAILWTIVSGIVAITSIIIMVLNPDAVSGFFSEFGNALSHAYSYMGINMYLFGIEFIITGLSQLAVSILMIYASISLGHLFSKRKILCSFGAFIGLSIIMNTIISTIAIHSRDIINIFSNIEDKFLATHTFFGSAIVINTIFFIAYFAITNYVLKNKLNLE